MQTPLITDWNDLRLFFAIARSESLALAARELALDTSTLSRRLVALETRLGTPLVRRGVAGANGRLTGAGQALFASVAEVARAVDAVNGALQGPRARATVRLTAPEELVALVLAPALAALKARAPDLRVELIGSAETLDLRRGEADLALRMVRPVEPGLVTRRLGTLRYSVFRGRGYRARPPAWLALDPSVGPWPEREWTRRRLDGATAVLHATSLGSLASAAAAGLGYAILPDALAARDRRLVQVEAGVGERTLWLVVPAGLRRVPAVRLVIDWVVKALGPRSAA